MIRHYCDHCKGQVDFKGTIVNTTVRYMRDISHEDYDFCSPECAGKELTALAEQLPVTNDHEELQSING